MHINLFRSLQVVVGWLALVALTQLVAIDLNVQPLDPGVHKVLELV